ncbi:MAG: hypothetical protein ACFWTY_01995 [Shouchella clausii]
MRLSILDQVPITIGQTAEQTAERTFTLVELAEQWGYERYWFAEHHGTRGLGSSAPEVWMAAAAARTKTIHVGSGGILLPQYSPYKVAAQLRQLETMFPGRIDGGIATPLVALNESARLLRMDIQRGSPCFGRKSMPFPSGYKAAGTRK